MRYQVYQYYEDVLAPIRETARLLQSAVDWSSWGIDCSALPHLPAALEMLTRFRLSHSRPDFGIKSVKVDHKEVNVREEVALELPFGNLLHFAKNIDFRQPKVLIVAPLSGHFSTLLRGTVETTYAR